jgi:eukaryotic-like serine/threonine-protein kinase
MTVAAGMKFGHYEILAPLGAGGMGEVWRARDTRLNREVAIKVLPASFANDADRLGRFEQEARATSALNHPNILTVYDIGTHDGSPYIVEELLEGEELRAQLNEGPIQPRSAIEYARQITDGLSAAHAKGVVHRDLKPENLFVTLDGRMKILDFGLAKLKPQHNDSVVSRVTTENRITTPGTVLGTVAYMSPEQVRGQEADHRSDIFAFGMILYEMLSGKRPFNGAAVAEVMSAILKEDPPELSGTNAKVSPALDKIVRRCLEKKPERRFQSASDLCFAFEAFASPSGEPFETATATPAVETGGSQAQRGGREKLWIGVTALALLLAAGFAWAYFARRPAPEARLTKLSLLPPAKSSFGHIAISPNGEWLAFTATTVSRVQLWVRAFANAEAKPFEGTEGATYPFWSPDSRFIGFFAGGKLKKVEVTGGLPATLCDVGVGTGGTWNREGVILFSTLGERGISRVSATGGAPAIVVREDFKLHETNMHDPSFLPDGRQFLYLVMSNKKEVRGIYVSSLDGGLRQRLLGDASNVVYAASGTGGGYLLFGREGALMAQPFDAQALQLGGEAFPVAGRVGTVLQGSTSGFRRRNFSVCNNGMLLFDPQPNRQRSQLLWVDRSGKTIKSLDRLDNVVIPRLAPDDKRFAVVRASPQDGNNDIWLSDVASGNPTRFTFDPGNDQLGVWSPDGTRLVWASSRSGVFDLYEKNTDLAGQDTLLLQSEHYKFPTDWSRDGRYIIYRQIDPQTKYDIWILPLFGEWKPFPFLRTEANEAAAVLSPDGRWIAYSSDETGRYEVYVEGFPGHGGKRQISTAGGMGPYWRGDGKELYYHAPDGKLISAPVKSGASLEVGAPVELFEFRASGVTNNPFYSVNRDGQRFLLSTIVETELNAPLSVVLNWVAEVKK